MSVFEQESTQSDQHRVGTYRDKVSAIVAFFGNEVIHVCSKLILEMRQGVGVGEK